MHYSLEESVNKSRAVFGTAKVVVELTVPKQALRLLQPGRTVNCGVFPRHVKGRISVATKTSFSIVFLAVL
jgi:hypothetical protein